MLEKTERKLRSYANNELQMSADGTRREIDNITSVDRTELDRLISLFEKVKPQLSIESGMAYGSSTMAILDYMERSGQGHHMAIDPGQIEVWHGIGLASIEELGFGSRFTLIQERSDQAFSRLIREAKRFQFIFLDGLQYFDGIITDFYLANQILDVGGVIVFNHLWMPGGRAVKSFVANNMTNYEQFPVESDQFFAFKKLEQDKRAWDYFVPFDGNGKQAGEEPIKSGLFRRLFGS